ncbi:MAG: DUF72 domain-containing protein [Thermoproteota archaeon]
MRTRARRYQRVSITGTKFPQVVTHDTRLGGGRDALEQFFQVMRPLERKLLCLLIQLPPSLTK